MKQHLVIAAIGCLVLLGGCTNLRTSQERWSLFPSGARYNFIQSVSPRYLWMRGGLWCGQVQQYDMKERKLTVFTERDGLPLSTNGVERLVASDDGRCLLMLEHEPRLFLWQEGLGWRSLPRVDAKHEVQDIAFDTDGRILVLATDKVESTNPTSCIILRLTAGKWQTTRTTSLYGVSAIVPFDDAYVLKSYNRKSNRSKLVHVPKWPHSDPVELPGELPDENRLKYFRLAGKTYMATPFPMEHADLPRFPGVRVMQTLREITPDGVVLTSNDTPQFLDLRSGTFQPMSFSVQPGRKMICEMPSIGRWEVDARDGATLFPIMNVNGDVWMPTGTYRNGQWTPTAGSRHEVHGIQAAQTEEAYYDADEGRWRRTVPPEYGSFSIVDPDKKLAWVVSDYKATTMRLMDFSGKKPRVIREVQREADWGLPSFQDSQGRWWMWRSNVVRLDPDGQFKRYPLESPTAIWLGPKTGDIWAADFPHYLRYDPRKDEFVPDKQDQLYDAHAFRLGAHEYSLLPLKHGLGTWSFMRKIDGKWVPAGDASRAGDRLLINDSNGVWELDTHKARWVRLHSTMGFRVAFDSQGRRILANHHGILLYDGDPFEDPGYVQYRALIEAQEKILTECLGLLASPDERIRQFAKLQIQDLSPFIRPKIEAIAEDDRTSEAVRDLLRELLARLSMEALPPGLFNAAHPPCPPYTPKPGRGAESTAAGEEPCHSTR